MKKSIILKEEMNITDINGLYNEIKELYNNKKEIIIDLKKNRKFDCSILQFIILLREEFKKNNLKYKIINMSSDIKNKFQKYGVDNG